MFRSQVYDCVSRRSAVNINGKCYSGKIINWPVALSLGDCAYRYALSCCEHLHMLCLSCAQCPPGMKQQVLVFYTKLLGRIRQPLLPHINVHRPVQVCVPLTSDQKYIEFSIQGIFLFF